MINPMQLMQMIQGNSNPMQMLMGMSQNDPQLRQILQMTNGKTPAEMQSMVMDEARKRGIDINQLAQQMGIRLPG